MVTAVKYPDPIEPIKPNLEKNNRSNTAAIAVVSTLFFLFGFIIYIKSIIFYVPIDRLHLLQIGLKLSIFVVLFKKFP